MPILIEFKPDRCFPPVKGRVQFDGLDVVPGVNYQHSESQVQKLLKHPDMPRYQRLGAIVVIESAVDPSSEVIPEQSDEVLPDLSGFTTDQTEDLIAQCHDLARLQMWLTKEQRRTVRQQLNKRITLIQEGKE